MATNVEEALKHKPKKPLNGYFKLRAEKYKEFTGDDGKARAEKFKSFWNEMDENKKNALNDEYHKNLEVWNNDIEAWKKKFGINDDDLKEYKKTQRQSES
jgi:hypothetical protein